MAMNVGERPDDDVMLEVNMTPLIDVMLVLIIMFIITIPAPNHAVNINMPNGNPPPSQIKPQIVDLVINQSGQMFWNKELIANKVELEQRFNVIAHQATQDTVQIKPEQNTNYKDVAFVMAAAQRLGVTNIGIMSNL